MNRLILKKQHNGPKFDELDEMICGLEEFLKEDTNPKDKKWIENFNAIIDFQDEEGSFRLYDSSDIPSDARVDFHHMPTYLCTAILIKAFLTAPEIFTIREKSALAKGLEAACARNLRGHGYEAFRGQIEALNIFMKAGLNEFLDLHHDLCPKFSEMIEKIIASFEKRESEGDFLGSWGKSYKEEIRAVNEYFCQRKVFVYGTLMSGEANHHYLENSKCLGKATVEGYDMYRVGWYPAIVPGDSLIIGELYQVPKGDMPSIDSLEGEGSLYLKRCESVTDADGRTTLAFVYVYIKDVSGLERITAWNKEYLWYVSYGSNMLRERFMCYIQGGSFEGSTSRSACNDTTPPVATKTVDIPYDMYFAKESRSWDYLGVSFLDTTKKGKSLGVAYLITKDQFKHVSSQENNGTAPEKSNGWYTDIIDLDPINGIEVKTITNNNLLDYNKPSQAYRDTLVRGIRQNWPNMSDEEIEDYLENCIR